MTANSINFIFEDLKRSWVIDFLLLLRVPYPFQTSATIMAMRVSLTDLRYSSVAVAPNHLRWLSSQNILRLPGPILPSIFSCSMAFGIMCAKQQFSTFYRFNQFRLTIHSPEYIHVGNFWDLEN